MSRDCLNRVILVGVLGADPEIRFTPSGTQVATVSLATTEVRTSRNGQRRERTECHRLVLWRQLAATVGRSLRKGNRVYAEGRLHTRCWEDPRGQRHYLTEVTVSHLQIADRAGGPAELELTDPVRSSSRPVLADGEDDGDGLPF